MCSLQTFAALCTKVRAAVERAHSLLLLFKGPFASFEVEITGYEQAREKFRGEVSVFGRRTALTASVDDLGS